ncbi:hypothetical protein AJ88_03870 [Mesorhizobium amorphae CCBAU 01583]|nr:hypothetical protein AJ88_03870 [Mesorhizobium amorphae CCBAU 01583]
MLARYDGDTEAALIAYNGGAVRADRWLASGRNDSVIPQESADYYKKVLARTKGGAEGQTVPRGKEQPIIIGDASGQGRVGNPDVAGVNSVVMSRFKQVQNAFGASVPIVSGFRDPVRNAKAGGARKSEHMHGNALDLDVSKLSNEERVRLIQTASSLGFTGIGVYANSLHLDIGSRRAWGASHHSDSVPTWARDAIAAHMAGKAEPLGQRGGAGFKVDRRFADMDYVSRDTIAKSAQRDIQTEATASRVQQQAQYKAYDDAMGLNIETGKIVSEDQILSDPVLDDATSPSN